MNRTSSDPLQAPLLEAEARDVAEVPPTVGNPPDPESPLTPGTARWERLNDRRIELIGKKFGGGLSPQEEQEYQALDAMFAEVVERCFPRRGPTDEEMASLKEAFDLASPLEATAPGTEAGPLKAPKAEKPLLPGNARWRRENARRAWLINKKFDEGLSDPEEEEFQIIQARFSEASKRSFPELGPTDEEMAILKGILDSSRRTNPQ